MNIIFCADAFFIRKKLADKKTKIRINENKNNLFFIITLVSYFVVFIFLKIIVVCSVEIALYVDVADHRQTVCGIYIVIV